jgi:hypothetical protein
MNRRSPTGRPRWTRSLAWAIALSLLFVVLYGITNWYTSTRADVGIVRFAWEEHIPLVPAFIVPYMSIDLFFFFAPFLCTTRRELSTHARRIIAVTIIAPVCFLLFPLQLGIERPEMSGIAGPMYELLKAFDYPYNMCPSMHVAYTFILRLLYTSHARGWLRWVLHVWFALVTMSVLLVYQHHVIDLIGGAALTVLVVYAIPSADKQVALPRRGAVCANRRIAGCFGAGAAVCIATGSLTAPAGFVLLWPGVSLAIVCAAYLGIGPRIYRKTKGKPGFDARILMAPYLAGLWISRMYYRARERGRSAGCEIVPGLIVGRKCTRREARAMIDDGLVAVLDLTAEHAETPPLRQLAYHNVQILDLTRPTLEQLSDAVRVVEESMPEGTVYVHCGLGYSRSAVVAAAVLLARETAANVDEACRIVEAGRSNVIFSDEAAGLLARFASRLVNRPEDQSSARARP